jgi:hypothetical protein
MPDALEYLLFESTPSRTSLDRMPLPCFAKRLPVEDEQDRADDEEDRLIDRTGDRQEAERD